MATNPVAAKRHKPPGWFTEALTGIALVFLGALALMFGMEHANRIWPAVTPIGYWDAFFLLLWADIIVNAVLFGVRVKVMNLENED